MKARQQGLSTYVAGRYYWRITHRKGVRAFILTHEQSATDNLFDMVKRYHENAPPDMQPVSSASSAKELYFAGLDSGYKVGTAGNKAVGRSQTIQYLHASEVAFWPNDREHAAGVFQAVPQANETEIILESTGNGMNNLFYEMCQKAAKGENEYQLIFVPWFINSEYADWTADQLELSEEEQNIRTAYNLNNAQMAWRRRKIGELGEYRFKQEYPATASEAFQTTADDVFIRPDVVLAARARTSDAFGPLIIGVDPASDGKDRTAIVLRRGKKLLEYSTHRFGTTMMCAGYVANLIDTVRPAMVCVDSIGIGKGIFDRLSEQRYGPIVRCVIASENADDTVRYKNKRAECWGRMKDWLVDGGSIPNDDELHADLVSLSYRYTSDGSLLMESKQDLRNRGARSPDVADALSLTFAYKVADKEISTMNYSQNHVTVKPASPRGFR